jgi:hypothetical protein
MTMKRLFIGGPWDGQVHDLANFAEVDPRYGCVQVPTTGPEDPITKTAVYYPRELRWTTDGPTGGVSIMVMSVTLSGDLGRPVLAALIKLSGIDVVWQHDPADSG